MTGVLIRHEIRLLLRDKTLLVLAGTTFVLMLAAIAAGQARLADHAREREAAAAADERVWLDQGQRNPHSAAHFSRYAFKPVPSLAILDPGSIDYAGLAIWLEAHYQDPAVLRRAEDGSELQRFGMLTPARILQIALPLFAAVMLFGAVAGEREDGTLRQLAATGVRAGAIFRGKLIGALLALALAVAPALLLVVWAGLSGSAGAGLSDRPVRVLSLVAVYGMYLVAVTGLALGVSALAESRKQAFLLCIGGWALLTILLPPLVAETAVSFHPHADAQLLNRQLRDASMQLWNDEAMQEQVRAATLAEHGVDDTSDLPFNWDAYFLQRSEEVANPQFDRIYDEVEALHVDQERVLAWGSWVAPVLAVQRLSAGLAGTDRRHHLAFAEAAEAHRRVIVRQLNDDMMNHAGEAGYAYMADQRLWEQIPALEHRPPRFRDLAGGYGLEAAVLGLWCLSSIGFARWSVGQAMRWEG